MAKDINLLPDITLNEEKDAKRQKLLTVVSIAIFILGLIGVLGAITVDLTVDNEAKKLMQENEQRKETVRSYAEIEIMQRSIKSKLVTSGNILNAAKDFKFHIENLQSLLPDSGITITSIGIDKINSVTISGKASSSDIFREYINNILQEDKGGKFFENVNMGSVATAKDGSLQFSLSLDIKKVEANK